MATFSPYVAFFAILGGLLVVTSTSAHAYLDPGTGSYMLQMLVAGVLAALFVARAFWSNLKEKFARLITRRRKK
jgi:hypothetical protein